jgi:hypothetical protein
MPAAAILSDVTAGKPDRYVRCQPFSHMKATCLRHDAGFHMPDPKRDGVECPPFLSPLILEDRHVQP